MPDRDRMIAAVKTHCRALTGMDKEGWLQIYADDVVFEDPACVDTFRGIDALRTTFWELVELTAPMRLGLLEDVIVCGNEAIAIIAAEASWQGTTRNVGPLVDHFKFGPDGKIVSMRAHWHFARHGYRPEMATDAVRSEAMIAVIETHCRAESAGEKETWVNIFADDIVIEDPVGSGNVHRGLAAVSTAFWDQAQQARPKVQLTQAPIVCGNEATAILRAEIGPDVARQTFAPIVAHFVFDDDCKVASLRAFFDYPRSA